MRLNTFILTINLISYTHASINYKNLDNIYNLNES